MRVVNIFHILRLEFLLDRRRKQGAFQFLLYGSSLLFLIGFASRQIQSREAILILFWLTQLFSVLFVNHRAFHELHGQGQRILYFLYHPLEYFFAKGLYYYVINLVLGSIYTLCFYLWFRLEPAASISGWMYLISSLTGLHLTSFISSALAARADVRQGLQSGLLAFPFMLPLLLLIWKLGSHYLQETVNIFGEPYFLMLWAVQGICLALSVLLFPYLWKP